MGGALVFARQMAKAGLTATAQCGANAANIGQFFYWDSI